MSEDEGFEDIGEFFGVEAVTPWEAALQVKEKLGRAIPGTKISVLTHSTNEISKFIIDDEGQILPADLFPVM